jgi:signal transduction histidine kinase
MAKISEDIKNLAIMAHDLKAPLSAVVNLLTIIEKGYVDDPEKVKDLISRARKKTETSIKMIDDIFDYTLTGSKGELKYEKLDIFTIVEEAVSIIRPYAAARQISLDYDRCCKRKYVNGNFTFLLRAFNNLIMNAVKYNKAKGKVSVSCVEQDDRLIIEVEDTGIGIPEEELAHIFDFFSRGKETGKNDVTGLGLGLALVKQIIKDHDGTVWITSDLGSGTTAAITLPVYGDIKIGA